MATWKGTPKDYDIERYHAGNGFIGNYEKVTYDWEYGTVTDSLTVKETDSQGTNRHHFGKWEAEAMLYTLAQWYGRYEGVDSLKILLKDILEAE